MNSHTLRWTDQQVRGRDVDVPAASNYLPQRDRWCEDGGFRPADTWYLDSRESEGTTVDARNSRLHLLQRTDENAPEEQEDDDDCW